jgi:membrane-associated protein
VPPYCLASSHDRRQLYESGLSTVRARGSIRASAIAWPVPYRSSAARARRTSGSGPRPVSALWQVLGGLLWSLGLTLAGLALGSRIPNVARSLLPIVAVIAVVSRVPVGVEVLRGRSRCR